MKKLFPLLLFSSCILVSTSALAQVTLTQTDFSNLFGVGMMQENIAAADTATYSMNVGSASASAQSWTFPSAAFADTSVTLNVNPASTPFTSTFPTATNAVIATRSGQGAIVTYTVYYRIANDSVVILGSGEDIQVGGHDSTAVAKLNTLALLLPITLGNSHVTHDTISQSPSYTQVNTTTETYDAFGSITLPNGIFQCLRSKSVIIAQITQLGSPLPNDTIVSFTWYTKEGHQAFVTAAHNASTAGTISVNGVQFVELLKTTTGVVRQPVGAAATFSLAQNYPNPFNPTTTISYSIPARAFVSLQVFDVLGKRIATLVDEYREAGTYAVHFDASNLPSGMYFYRLQAGNFTQTRKLLLMK